MPVQSITSPVVWCDFGGVLTAPAADTLASFCARIGVPAAPLVGAMKAVASHYGTDDIMEPLDTPLVTADEWTSEVERILLREHEIQADLSRFAEDWFTGRPANDELIAYLWELKEAGIFVGMLSNMVPDFEPYWPKMVSPALFDDFVFSYQVGFRKPALGIYDLSAARASARPESCILIDDLVPNCEGARKAGWQAIEFRSNADVLRQMRLLVRA
jgi:putative hydrolase of the HAD superfamily